MVRGTLVGALLLAVTSIISCEKTYEKNQDGPITTGISNIEEIRGKVVAVDEDSVLVFTMNKFHAEATGTGEFQYEVVSVRSQEKGDEEGRLYTLILPFPSSYAIGDDFLEKYMKVDGKIPFSYLIEKHSNMDKFYNYSLQKGYIRVDGIVER